MDVLPALAHYYGVRPWEVGMLTELELRRMIDWIPKKADG